MNANNIHHPDPDEVDPREYTAEAPVNMRHNRLRRVEPTTDATPAVDEPGPEATEDVTGNGLRAVDGLDVVLADGPESLRSTSSPMSPRAQRTPDREHVPDPVTGPVMVNRAELSDGLDTDPARWGWRGRVNAAAGLSLRPPADGDEVAYRRAVARVQQTLVGTAMVTVINVKGGQGKTPTTLVLSNIFGALRGGSVVAWDANESKGTLADRAAAGPAAGRTPTDVWDLLEHAGDLGGPNAASGALGAFLRRQPSTDEVLASDQSSTRARAIGASECAAVMSVLRRHRQVVFVDTGNDDLAENWQWVTAHAHQLVIPMTIRRDTAAQVVHMLHGLHSRGLSHLVATAIVTIAATPESDVAAQAAIIDDLTAAGIGHILQMPYEPAFAAGGPIVASRLSQATTAAYTALAGAVADNLAAATGAVDVGYDAGEHPQSITRPVEHTPAPIPARVDTSGAPSDAPPVAPQPQPAPVMDYRDDDPGYGTAYSAVDEPRPAEGGWGGGPTDRRPRPSQRRRWLIVAAGIALVLAVLVGSTVALFGGNDDTPAARPAATGDPLAGGQSGAPAPADGPQGGLGGDADCPTTATGGVFTGRDAGGTDSGPNVIKAFEHGYYVARSGAAARAVVTPNARVASAPAIQTLIDRTDPETSYCTKITDRGFGQWALELTEIPPRGGAPEIANQLIQTTVADGKTWITAITSAAKP